jgi:hypothetical protein
LIISHQLRLGLSPHGHLLAYRTLSPREEMESCIALSIQSRAVKTEIIENIPIVIPKRDKNVLSLFTITDLKANTKPSFKSLKNILSVY